MNRSSICSSAIAVAAALALALVVAPAASSAQAADPGGAQASAKKPSKCAKRRGPKDRRCHRRPHRRAATAALRRPTAEVESCKKLKGSAKRRCQAGNAANRVVLKKLLDTRLVGARGDGAAVDWSFCRSGKLITAVTSDGSTGRSTSNDWQVANAKVRQGGRWFNAIVTSSDGTGIAVAMRGGRWKVGIESFDEVSELGDATRSSARESCAAT